MVATTVIAASEAKAKFSELLERTRRGEGSAITLHGEEVAKLVPAKRVSLEDVQNAITAIKTTRTTLNPPGMPNSPFKNHPETLNKQRGSRIGSSNYGSG